MPTTNIKHAIYVEFSIYQSKKDILMIFTCRKCSNKIKVDMIYDMLIICLIFIKNNWLNIININIINKYMYI